MLVRQFSHCSRMHIPYKVITEGASIFAFYIYQPYLHGYLLHYHYSTTCNASLLGTHDHSACNKLRSWTTERHALLVCRTIRRVVSPRTGRPISRALPLSASNCIEHSIYSIIYCIHLFENHIDYSDYTYQERVAESKKNKEKAASKNVYSKGTIEFDRCNNIVWNYRGSIMLTISSSSKPEVNAIGCRELCVLVYVLSSNIYMWERERDLAPAWSFRAVRRRGVCAASTLHVHTHSVMQLS